MKLNILTEGFVSYNGIGFLTPIIKNINNLKNLGTDISFFTKYKKSVLDCDVLLIDSKFYRKYKIKFGIDYIYKIFSEIKSHQCKTVFFDLGDGTSMWAMDIIPYVDRYCKSYVLKDKQLYKKQFYGSRIWTDYYKEEFSILDTNENSINNKTGVLSESDLSKIVLSYNSSFADYSLNSRMYNTKTKKYLSHIFSVSKYLVNYSDKREFIDPSINRSLELSCRMNVKYDREGVVYHRKKAAEILNKYLKFDKIDRNLYMDEMSNSKVVVSPFGWGEVNYKDYEAILCGSLLLKPDMNHMDTFPNFFKENNVAFYKWDYSDILDVVDNVLSNYSQNVQKARETQDLYKYYLLSDAGQHEFCIHFNNLIKF